MSNPHDDPYAHEVITTVMELTRRMERFERDSSAERAAFRATIEASIVQLRRDFHAALAPIQLNEIDHRKVHEVDRAERIERQAANDATFRDMRALIYLVIGLLVGFIITGIIIMAR